MPSKEVTFTINLPVKSVWSFMTDRPEVGCLFPRLQRGQDPERSGLHLDDQDVAGTFQPDNRDEGAYDGVGGAEADVVDRDS